MVLFEIQKLNNLVMIMDKGMIFKFIKGILINDSGLLHPFHIFCKIKSIKGILINGSGFLHPSIFC